MKKIILLALVLCNSAFAQGVSNNGGNLTEMWFVANIDDAIKMIETENPAAAQAAREEVKKYTIREATDRDVSQPAARNEGNTIVVDKLVFSGFRVDTKTSGNEVLVSKSYKDDVMNSALREGSANANITNVMVYPAIACFRVIFNENKTLMNLLIQASNKMGSSYELIK